MYNAFILPHLQYCSTVWHFCSARNCDKLESLKKRALRIVFNDKVSSYQQLLHKSEGSTLYNRRIQNMLITIYKCLNYNSFLNILKTCLLCVSLNILLEERIFYLYVNLLMASTPFIGTPGLPNNVRSESTLSGFRRHLKAISY